MLTPRSSRQRWAFVLDFLLILLAAAYVVRPLFKAKYIANWMSIESTFIADGRFLHDHWPHPNWQPLWYCGTRFDYIYPPALRYGTALLSYIWLPVKAYHVYTAFFFCLGIAGVYFLVRTAGRSRAQAWLAALAALLLSPSFLFLKRMRVDSLFGIPQRLGVLVRYGEGPHMTSVALLGFALAFALYGLRRGHRVALALTAVFAALVVSNNFYGATSLAFLFPILAWSVWVGERDPRVWLRAAAIAALAYGLTASWLSPSYLRITLRNMQYVSHPPHAWSVAVLAAAALGFALLSLRLAGGRPARIYPVFLCGAVLFFCLHVIGYFLLDFRVAGEPGRLVPELDLVLILGGVELLGWLWNRGSGRWTVPVRIAAVLVVAASFATAIPFLRGMWTLYPREPDYQKRIEYRMSDWVWRHIPNDRVMVSGSTRFWWDTWHDLAQPDGGSAQGMLNGSFYLPQWEILLGPTPELSVDWLKAFGCGAVIVHDQRSQEVYHDFQKPAKFAGVLPVLYDTGEGDTIYQVPRRYPALARVVNRADFQRLLPFRNQLDLERARAYVKVIEEGPDAPITAAFEGTDAMRVRARVAAGQQVLVQETFDPNWRASSNGRPVAIRQDPNTGFMVLDAPPGDDDIRLVFTTPLENVAGRILSVLALLIVCGLLVWRRTFGPPHGFFPSL